MSKINLYLKLKDLYAIKHALESSIKSKQLGLISYEGMKFLNEEIAEMQKRYLKKDIEHETK